RGVPSQTEGLLHGATVTGRPFVKAVDNCNRALRMMAALALTLVAVLASCSNNDNPATPGDTTAPSRVTDLTILSAGDSTLTIRWTAPGDDGHTGKAKSYQIRL